MPHGSREGRVDVQGGSIWYRVLEGGDRLPLVTLHGGPGFPSISLQPLEALATDRPVVFYDQLGCGNSDRPEDESLWAVDRFVDELESLLDHLGYDEVHLLGHSWGTLLALEFYLAHPGRVASIVMVGPWFSTPRWIADCGRLISGMPPELRAIHANPDATEKDIELLNTEFRKRHILRLDEAPDAMKEAREGFGLPVYNAMWGPNEFTSTGTLKDYDRTNDLTKVEVPVLFVCGRHDEATPESATYFASLVPEAQLHVLEEASHFPFLEQPDEFLEAVGDFLATRR
ncbi:MAG: proline iminopeptidase-family hydrolase [Acidimicrobiia bacterium]|nr:proline iminopeptidase-family hydrolase [Acidimicrobiia bacterium]